MALQIRSGKKTKFISKLITIPVLMLALVAQPMYTFVTSQMASAAPANTTYTSRTFDSFEWVKDRSEPTGVKEIGSSTLTIGVDGTQRNANSWYRFEGIKTSLPANVSSVKATVDVNSEWQGIPDVSAELWTKVPVTIWGSAYPYLYPVLRVGNDATGQNPTVRVWSPVDGNDYGITPVTYGASVTLEIESNPHTGQLIYYVNDSEVYRQGGVDWGYGPFEEVFLNHVNPGGGIENSYRATWTNLQLGTKQAMAAPTGLKSTAQNGSDITNGVTNLNHVRNSWTAVDGAASYNYQFRKPNSLPTFSRNQTATFVQGQFHNSNSPEGQYDFRVQAVSATGLAGQWSEWSNVSYDKTAPSTSIKVESPSGTGDLHRNAVRVTGVVDPAEDNIKSHWFEITHPDGSLSYSQNMNTDSLTYSFELDTSKGDGEYKLRYVATDRAGNRSDDPGYSNSTTRTIVVDTIAPVLTNGPLYAGLSHPMGVPATWDYTGSMDVAYFEYREYRTQALADADVNGTVNGESGAYWIPNRTGTNASNRSQNVGHSHTTSRNLYYRIVAVDTNGNRSAPSAVGVAHIDKVVPNINTPSVAEYLRGEQTFEITQDETNPDRTYVEYMQKDAGGDYRKLDGKWFNDVNEFNYTVDTARWADGEYQVKISTWDKANNHASSTFQFTIDNTAPTGTFAYSHSNNLTNQDVTVSLTTSEEVQDIAGWTRTGTNTFTKVFTANGKFTVAFTDIAGNNGGANGEVKRIDKVVPVFLNIADGESVTGSSFVIQVQDPYNNGAHGIYEKLTVDGSPVNLTHVGGFVYEATINGVGGHTVTVRDKANNEATITFSIGDAVPASVVTITNHERNDDGTYTIRGTTTHPTDTVKLWFVTDEGHVEIEGVVVDAEGNWSATTSEALEPGEYALFAVTTNEQGAPTSVESHYEFTVASQNSARLSTPKTPAQPEEPEDPIIPLFLPATFGGLGLNDGAATTPLPATPTTETDDDTDILGAQDTRTSWSAVNAALAGFIAILALVALAGIRRKETDNNAGARLFMIVPAAAAVIAFFLIEDISGSMAWFNVWTWLFAGILVVQAILATLTTRTAND